MKSQEYQSGKAWRRESHVPGMHTDKASDRPGV
jgi:hypothetical protein